MEGGVKNHRHLFTPLASKNSLYSVSMMFFLRILLLISVFIATGKNTFGQILEVKDCNTCLIPANGDQIKTTKDQTQEYSFQFVLRNSDSVQRRFVLALGPGSIRKAVLYQKGKDSLQYLGATGYEIDFKLRSYQFAHYTIPVQVQPHSQETFQLTIQQGNDFRAHDGVLIEERHMNYFESQFYFTVGIIVGLLILFLIINLYLYVAIKEKVHFWFSAYILVIIVILAGSENLLEQFFSISFGGAVVSGLNVIAVATFIHAMQIFLASLHKHPLITGMLTAAKLFLFLAGMGLLIFHALKSTTFIQPVIFTLFNYFSLSGLLLLLTSCLIATEKDFRIKWILILGILLSVGSAFQRLFVVNYQYNHPLKFYHVASILEILAISFVLIYRYRLERLENVKLQQEKERLQTEYKMQLLQNKIETREKTFKNISQEIHDNIGQLLTLVKINLDTLESPVSVDYEKKISTSQELLARSQNDLHQLSQSLKAGEESHLEIIQYIESELELISKTALFKTRLVIEGTPFPLNNKDNALSRICQEVFNNIIKHSNAKHIFIEIVFKQNDFLIKIVDDGEGFSVSKLKESKENYGLGLRNMRDRAKSIDAELIVQSTPGTGTAITIQLKNQRV